MSGGPLYWFRKNQKILLVVFGVLLMIVFTVGGVLDSLFSGQGQMETPVRQVASTSFGNFTNADMDEFAEGNRRAAEFTFELYLLSGDPSKAKAVPIPPLNNSSTEARDRDILSRLTFAKFAEDNGLYVGDEIINDYFNRLCNNELGNLGKTVDQFSRELQRGSLSRVKAHLKTELLARSGQQMISAGVNPQFSQQGFLVGVSPTPVEIWEGYRRLKERFKIEYMPLDVADAESISAEPSEEEMRALYQEGMDRAPEAAYGPGFKKPRTANVAYFAADFEKFLAAEKAKITEQQIQERYQQWVEDENPNVVERTMLDRMRGLPDGGAFQPSGDAPQGDAPQEDAPAENPPTDAAPPLNPPTNESGDNTPPPSGDSDPKAATEKAKTGQPAAGKTEPPSVEPPGPESAAPGKSEEGDPAATNPPKTEEATPPKKDDGDQQSAIEFENRFQFVTLTQEESENSSTPAKSVEQENPATQQENTEQKNTDEKPAEQKPADEKPTADNAGDPQATGDPQSPPSAVPPADVQQDQDPSAPQQETEKPPIKPLDDDIRKLILNDLAEPVAAEAITAAMDAAKAEVSTYLNDYGYYAENPEEIEYLEVPDFEKIAQDKGLVFKQFENVDYRSLKETEFGQVQSSAAAGRGQTMTVAEEIFFGTFLSGSSFEIYTAESAAGVEYAYWVTDKKFREKVSFEEAKPAIVKYFKSNKAVEEAEAKAAKIARDVSEQNKTLSAEFGDQVKTSQEFGWMELDATIEGLAQRPEFAQQLMSNPNLFSPRMGQIRPETPKDAEALDAEPLDGVDHAFMSRIFELDENEIGYAVTEDRDQVYVIQVIQRTEIAPEEMDRFFSQFSFGLAQRNSQLDHGRDLNTILSAEDLLEKYSVKWFGEEPN